MIQLQQKRRIMEIDTIHCHLLLLYLFVFFIANQNLFSNKLTHTNNNRIPMTILGNKEKCHQTFFSLGKIDEEIYEKIFCFDNQQ